MMNKISANGGSASGGKNKKPTVLIIMDGWGVAPAWGGNAVAIAKTPNFNRFMKEYPSTLLEASGEAVGLPGRSRGNSEVGHLNLGAGKIVHQDLARISSLIRNQSFFENEAMMRAIEHVKKNNSALHLMGLLSDTGTHSHTDHLYALLDLAKQNQLEKVYIHVFSDGRDTEPRSCKSFLQKLEDKIKQVGVGEIASVSGRYYSMDRDNRWERIEKSYDALVFGKAQIYDTPEEAIEVSYGKGVTDEFVEPALIRTKDKQVVSVSDNDSIIFFNFRPDRARQLTKAFVADDFTDFDRKKKIKNLVFVTFVLYEEDLPVLVAFEPENVEYPVAKVLSMAGKDQFHIAETEKYAHVTYFFNGGQEKPFKNESRFLVSSPRVATYDLQPEMSALEITEELLSSLKKNLYDFIVVNYANADMVGHTGNIKATVRACEVVDEQLGRVAGEVLKAGGVAIITADHGNAEQMINPITGEPDTEHTTNPVPFILVSDQHKKNKIENKFGILGDVSATILDIMGIPKPAEMTRDSLIKK